MVAISKLNAKVLYIVSPEYQWILCAPCLNINTNMVICHYTLPMLYDISINDHDLP